MVIVMQEGATDAQIQHVIDRLVASGFNVHRSTGESHTVLGAVGVHRDFDHRDFELLDGVREVMRITQPFKLASRQFKPEGTIVDLGRSVKIGGPDVVVATTAQVLVVASNATLQPGPRRRFANCSSTTRSIANRSLWINLPESSITAACTTRLCTSSPA